MRKDICVAVRDVRTQEWLRAHMALKQRISGSIRFQPSDPQANTSHIKNGNETPVLGASLYFFTEGREMITSPVVAIDRPDRNTVLAYPY